MYRTSTLLLLLLFCFLLLPSPTTAQAIPDLPPLTPVPTLAAPSPAPSRIPTSTPSTSPPPKPTGTEPPPDPDSKPLQFPPEPVPPPPTASPSPDPSIAAAVTEDRVCQRDPTHPRPRLGTTQARYALAVLGSAAAVAVASLLYSGVYTWNKDKNYTVWRYLGIVTSRVLIYLAVRFSAALVAAITKESPGDSALDASGAFLTWGSGIFTRMYHEGVVMTLAALDIMDNEHRWDDKLHEYLNPGKSGTSAAQTDAENPPRKKSDVDNDKSVWQHVFGGMLERKLLFIIAVVYFGQEIAVLIVNINDLIGAFESKGEQSFFFADDAEGQCSIDSGDVAFFILVVFVQSLYALTYQPSLIPLLMVGGFPKERKEESKRRAVLMKVQVYLPYIILLIWTASLATYPLLKSHLELIYMAGDTSLFWFVVLAPPSYSSTSYIVIIIYAILASMVGAFLLYRIRNSNFVKAE